MKEIIKIPNVHDFYGFYKEYFLVESTDLNNVLFFTEKDLQFSHLIQMYDPRLRIKKNNIYVYTNDEKILIYSDEQKGFIVYKENKVERYAIFNESLLFGNHYDEENKILTVMFFDMISQKKLWQQDYENRIFPLVLDGNLFLSDIRITYLEKIDIETGKNEWIFDFGMRSRRKILKYSNTLIIPLDNNHLLGVNLETGEKLWELEDCFNYYYLEENTGLLYGYAWEIFEIIDALKGEKILHKQLTGSAEQYVISPDQSMNILAGDALYFVSNWKATTKFGKINVRTQEIEFVQELIENEDISNGRVTAKAPICHNGRLYILDSVGTLHIFEKE
jgi:hypothetical protein